MSRSKIVSRSQLLAQIIIPPLQPHFTFPITGKTKLGDPPSRQGLGLDGIGLAHYASTLNLWLHLGQYPNVTIPEVQACDTVAGVANLVGDKMNLPPPPAA